MEVIMNTLKKRTFRTLLTGTYLFSLLAVPFSLTAHHAPVDTTWHAVQENGRQTFKNIWGAVANLASYVPGACKQITHETKILSAALKECPLATAVVLSAATYSAWKTYSWLKGNGYLNKAQYKVNIHGLGYF